MPQLLANLDIHLIFSTKERVPCLSASARPDLHAYMATVLANLHSPAVLLNSVADHVHLLFNMGRTITLAQVVKYVKKSSSKWIKTQHTALAGFAWQAGYGAFSVSDVLKVGSPLVRFTGSSRAQAACGRGPGLNFCFFWNFLNPRRVPGADKCRHRAFPLMRLPPTPPSFFT